jgi:uncharacterized protein
MARSAAKATSALSAITLSVRHLELIASASAGSPAVTALARAQLSKRLLLISHVARAASLSTGAFAAAWQALDGSDAMALLDRARTRDRAAVDLIIGHPFLDLWAARALRATSDGDSVDIRAAPGGTADARVGYLNTVALAAAAVAGCAASLPLPAPTDRWVALPTLGHVALGQDAPTVGIVRLCTGPDGWSITVGRTETPAEFVAHARLDAAVGSSAISAYVEESDPLRDCFDRPLHHRLDDAQLAAARDLIRRAWTLLRADHPIQADALSAVPIALVPLLRPQPGVEVSAASARAFGAIGTTIPDDPVRFAEILVHEFQHAQLGALLDLVDLHTGATDRFPAPWRADLRPIGALLQGTSAHLAVANFWLARSAVATAAAARAARDEFDHRRAQVETAIGTLLESGALTELGHRFVELMRHTTRRWPGRTRSAD